MTQGIVTSLEILVIGMGYRGSKSVVTNSYSTVKEQRVDGSSVCKVKSFFCKVYSSPPMKIGI